MAIAHHDPVGDVRPNERFVPVAQVLSFSQDLRLPQRYAAENEQTAGDESIGEKWVRVNGSNSSTGSPKAFEVLLTIFVVYRCDICRS